MSVATALGLLVGEPSTESTGAEHRIDRSGRSLTRYLPQVALATGLVAILPVLAVWQLRAAGWLTSPWISVLVAMGLSTVLSSVGCAYWKRRQGSGDLLFSELLVWGWLRRWRVERQLANAVQLLALLKRDGHGRFEGWPAGRQEQLLRQVAGALEAEDRYTRGHSDRVARFATSIARKMGLPKGDIETIRAAALVHDIGKLRVPPEVLNKPSRLTDAEFALIKRHPVDGAEIVAGLQHDELTAIVRHHHERLDGRGYPDGLTGEQIPLGARIIAVADTFDAITSVRPYRSRGDHKKALDILVTEQGTQLDRDAVRAFLTCYSGRRSIAVWSVVTTVFQRVGSALTGQASAATITTGSAAATVMATAAVGGIAMIPAAVVHAHSARTPVASVSVAAPQAQAASFVTRVGGSLGGLVSGPRTAGGHGSVSVLGFPASGLRPLATGPRSHVTLAAGTTGSRTAAQKTSVPGAGSSGSRGSGAAAQGVSGGQVTPGGQGGGVGQASGSTQAGGSSPAGGGGVGGGQGNAGGNGQGNGVGGGQGNAGGNGQGNGVGGGQGNAGGNGQGNGVGGGQGNAGGNGQGNGVGGGQGNAGGNGQGNGVGGGQGNAGGNGQGNGVGGGQGNAGGNGQGNGVGGGQGNAGGNGQGNGVGGGHGNAGGNGQGNGVGGGQGNAGGGGHGNAGGHGGG